MMMNDPSSSMHDSRFLRCTFVVLLVTLSVDPCRGIHRRSRGGLDRILRSTLRASSQQDAVFGSESNHRLRRPLPWTGELSKPQSLMRIAQFPRGGSSKEEEDESEYDSEEQEEYDEEEEEETEEDDAEAEDEEPSINTEGVRIEVNVQKFDEPLIASPLMSIYTTVGVMYLSRKVDFFAPKSVRIIRFAFLAFVLLQQMLLIFFRIQARIINDKTPIELTNPLSSMLQNNLSSGKDDDDEDASNNTNGMMKSLASSFLRSSSTVLEYDLQQTRSLQTGLIINMLTQYFLHFKMEQVQPVILATLNGLLQLVYSPLFQVYVMGRNLERPFKTAATLRMEQMKNMSPPDAAATAKEAAADEESEHVDLATEDDEEETASEEEGESYVDEDDFEEEEMEESDEDGEEVDEEYEAAEDTDSNEADDDFDEDEDFSDPE